MLRVTYDDGDMERYFLPLTTTDRAKAEKIMSTRPNCAVA
jgi:hypothetical protein